MNDLQGKIAAVLLLGSAAFSVYIGANIPMLSNAITDIGGKSPDTNTMAKTLTFSGLFASAVGFTIIAVTILTVKSRRSMNITMGVVLLGFAGLLAYIAAIQYGPNQMAKESLDLTSGLLSTFYGDKGKQLVTTSTAVAVLPSYAAITGTIAAFISSVLIFMRKY